MIGIYLTIGFLIVSAAFVIVMRAVCKRDESEPLWPFEEHATRRQVDGSDTH